MNVRSRMSGQLSRQVPDQTRIVMGQNGNVFQPTRMQNFVGSAGSAVVAHQTLGIAMPKDFQQLRQFMLSKIFSLLQRRQPSHNSAASEAKLMEVARRLEDALMQAAKTKEEYLDLKTLESRIGHVLKQVSLQQHAHPSSSGGTMIPTPGVSSGGSQTFTATPVVDSSMRTSDKCNNLTGQDVKTATLLQTSGMHGGSFFDGCQQLPGGFPIGSGANVSSVAAQGMTGQMIPTPGFNNGAHNNLHCRMKEETSCDSGQVSAVEAVERWPPVGPNCLIPHKLGNETGGFESGLRMKSSGMTISPQTVGLGMQENNLQLANEDRTCEGFLYSKHLQNLAKPLQQPVDQRQRSWGHGYAMSNSDCFGSGNFYGSITPFGSMVNAKDVNSMSLNPMLRVDTSFASNQPNMHRIQQVPPLKPEGLDQFENLESSFTSRKNMAWAHQQLLPQQLQHESRQFQQQEQASQQLLHEQNQQQQHILNEDTWGQSQPDLGLVARVKREAGLSHHTEVLRLQAADEFQPSMQQNQCLLNSAKDHCIIARCASVSCSQQDISPLAPSHSQQMQQISNVQDLPFEACNDLSNLSVGVQSVSVQGQWHPQSQDWTQISKKPDGDREHIQVNLCQRIPGQHEALNDGSSARTPMFSRTIAPRSATGTLHCSELNSTMHKPLKEDRDPKYENQKKFLLFLFHARSCTASEGKCESRYCSNAKDLLKHIDLCKAQDCKSRCLQTRKLIDHYKLCRDEACPVCGPVRNFQEKQKSKIALRKAQSGLPRPNPGHSKPDKSAHASARRASEVSSDSDDLQPSWKRLKVEVTHQCVAPDTGSIAASVSAVVEAYSSPILREKDIQKSDIDTAIKSEIMHVETDVSDASLLVDQVISKKDVAEGTRKERHADEPMCDKTLPLSKQENLKCRIETNPPMEDNVTQPMEIVFESKTGKSKIKGVSLIELLSPLQVREHIRGLRQWVGQSKTKAEKNKAMQRSMTENSCQLCGIERLAFEPVPMYCMLCGARIKRNAMHYTVAAGGTRQYVCIPCYNEARGDTLCFDGTPIPKARFEKRKNDEEIEEWWVQCDKCESWQHQICALFNGQRNDGQAEYMCPNCYIQEVERGERKPLPQSTVLGAKDLPSTILSNHIEQRLFKKLRQEREERARLQGKSYDEVPGAESLVVRVVSSVDKTLEVKPYFLDLFREENYPLEFPYKSKAILLFQKIEGVEVCLFGMYVQEFGTECALPNQRRVYLSYLDSVKYFRPDVRTVTGEALRTFVYHEILIGYLEYCKKRGFMSCYIWACPPLKGEDYILYCHPEIQKTPKTDKLREWYLAMLRKASKENVVVECTNFYDHFFIQTGECRAKVTAVRLPYFDGDYWPGAAEDLIRQMSQDDDGQRSNKKGTTKKIISKRALKAAGRSDLSVNASKDLLLMHKLGETISPMKEDFIMVHLQHCCKHCCILMVSGNRWVCDKCKNFQICDKCYEAEQNREAKEKHPVNQKETHALHPVAINDVPIDTTDKDGILESEFFDTRQAFLSLCQGNHYQYDTLRRAKHSSMMVLHHLHNPSAPAFATTCTACQQDIETGQGWRCEVCPDYDVCNACYLKGIDHPHNLMNHPSATEQEARNTIAQRLHIQGLRELLVHVARCSNGRCEYPRCLRVKKLFRHAKFCKLRASGGCGWCKRMWDLLQIHARNCRESKCVVPRCRDLRVRFSRLQQQSDSRRRAAVKEMMRQRATEVGASQD